MFTLSLLAPTIQPSVVFWNFNYSTVYDKATSSSGISLIASEGLLSSSSSAVDRRILAGGRIASYNETMLQRMQTLK